MGWKLYDLLEIPREASKEDIKKAYKKKAVETHPDKGGDPEKFKEINNAYSILNNDDQRARYDQLGDEGFNSSANGGGGMSVDPNEIFSQFFGSGFNFHFNHPHERGGHENTKRADHRHVFRIKLDEAFTGFKKNLRIVLQKYCHKCRSRCYACQGQGQITEMHRMGFFTQMTTRPCGSCNGSGTIVKGNPGCTECKGQGTYSDEKIVEVNVPAGVDNGFHITYKGLGEQPLKPSEVPGDLVIEIQVLAHETFVRQGNDLLLKQSISLKDSIIGTKITIQHFSGNFQFNTCDIGIVQNTRQYVIKNKGMSIRDTKELGNMIVTFEIHYPTVKISPENGKRLLDLFNEIGL